MACCRSDFDTQDFDAVVMEKEERSRGREEEKKGGGVYISIDFRCRRLGWVRRGGGVGLVG